jgi:hypothetical protein
MLSGFNDRECRMNVGKTLFAQVMEFVPWKTFGRIIERHKGDASVRTLGCADLFRIMAFSQLTWRESLRDIEVCLEANRSKLFHMGIAAPPARSTLSDALNLRDWRIYHALALRLISHARALYAQDPSLLGLDASVYALDSTTIDLCLSLFDWAPFRSTKAAIKLHTLLDLRGAIPAFIHISDGKMHDVTCWTSFLWKLDASTSWTADTWTSRACMRCTRLEPFSSHAPSRTWMRGACIRIPPTGPAELSAINASCSTASTRQRTTRIICVAFASAIHRRARRWSF